MNAKTKILISIFTLFTSTSKLLAQPNITGNINPQLINVIDIFEHASFDKIIWENSTSNPDSGFYHAPVRGIMVMHRIDTLLKDTPVKDSRVGEIKEFSLIKKYRKNLDSAFNDLDILETGEKGRFLYTKDGWNPIHFGLYSDTALALVISGLRIDKVYNTLKLTSRQRAAKVIISYILPQLIVFLHDFPNSEIKYFGLTCLYGSKDFSDDSYNETKGEFIGFAAPRNIILKYILHQLSEDDFINAADIYLSDRDMKVFEIKKIKISID